MTLRAMIVDDEPPARMVLEEMLRAMTEPRVEIAASCGDGFEAVTRCLEVHPEVMLLDIQMPKLDGFEVLEVLARGRPAAELPAVVFVTAHDEHALRAFEVHAVDYLLKPFRQERLEAALRRALERRRSQAGGAAELAAAAQAAGAGGWLRRIAVREGAKVTLIPVEALDYVQAEDDYVALTAGGKKHWKQQTLASVEAGLDPQEFVRIHRSYLVRLARVARIENTGKDSFEVVLAPEAGGARLPLSRTGQTRLRERLGL